MALSYVRCLFLRPTFAATAPRSAVAQLGVVRRCSRLVKIEYETNYADVESWNQRSLMLPEVKRAIQKRALSMAVTTGLVVGGLAYGASRNIIAAVIIGGLLFLVIAALAGSALRHETLKNTRKALEADPTNPALGHHTLEVTPESITETCSHHALSVQWHAVANAIRTEDHLFILLRSLAAIIVPLRSFVSDIDRETFISHVLQFTPSQTSSAE